MNTLANQCLIFHLQKGNTPNETRCPECPAQLSQSEINGFKIAWEKAPFKIDIDSLFKNSRANNTDNSNNLLNDPATQKGEFFVVLLSGDKYSLKLEEVQTVRALKAELTKRIKVDGSKQKLLHKGVELQVSIYLNINYFINDFKAIFLNKYRSVNTMDKEKINFLLTELELVITFNLSLRCMLYPEMKLLVICHLICIGGIH